MTTMTTDKTITVTPPAAEAIAAMHQQAAAVEEAWRSTKPEAGTKALRSCASVLSKVFTLFGDKPVMVYRDDEVSLTAVVTDSGFTMGVIFFRDDRFVKAAVPGDVDMSYGAAITGRYCMNTVDDGKYCGKPYGPTINSYGPQDGVPSCTCRSHFPVTMPVPGEWSTHS